MEQAMLEQRVSTLEDLMAELLRASARTQRQVEQTSREMRAFKNEMLAFKDEMRDFKDEMRAFKDEMLAFKDERRESRREMNRRWGELANKMGTMAEDLVAPSIPRILRTVVGCPDNAIESIGVRMRRRHPDTRQLQEFDVVATCGEYMLINETKSSLDPDAVTQFVELLSRVREFFPEYADKKVIGAIASLYVDPSLVRFAERQGLIVLGFGEDVMDVLNSPEFTPREF
jgi:hypothetical protein